MEHLISDSIKKVVDNIRNKMRISSADAILLWHEAPLSLLGLLASEIKHNKSGEKVYYNRNIHIEPTNICTFNCTFCSYKKKENDPQSWNYSLSEIRAMAEKEQNSGITEVHIVGGVHPKHDLNYYCQVIAEVKSALPEVTVKAYTAVELYHIIKKSGLSLEQGLRKLMDSGMSAIPGGGAEIFNDEIRSQICPDKIGSQQWLELHQIAHQLGLRTNATILYGHIESVEHRIEHLEQLRQLQDVTSGFDTFIPLKYRNKNNILGNDIRETPLVDDMRMMALSRIYLDNFNHIKAYWAMLGKENTQLSLCFGADDIDGTISDTTKIYSMAGAKEQKPTMTVSEIEKLISQMGYIPTERDTYYNEIKRN